MKPEYIMSLRINDTIPDLTVETDQGTISLHDWVGDSWAILFSHPKDFTPVCTTEFGAVAQLADEWEKRGTKVMGISVDGVDEHKKWKGDIETFAGAEAGFPIIADSDLTVAKAFDMLPADAETVDDLSDDRWPQLCRSAACAGRAANLDRQGRGNTGELECRRRCDHPRNPVGR